MEVTWASDEQGIELSFHPFDPPDVRKRRVFGAWPWRVMPEDEDSKVQLKTLPKVKLPSPSSFLTRCRG